MSETLRIAGKRSNGLSLSFLDGEMHLAPFIDGLNGDFWSILRHKIVKVKNLILLILAFICLACSSFFAQDLNYKYAFDQKLRHNVDVMLTKNVADTCGIIKFKYPIDLTNSDEGSLNFMAENDCSPVIDFSSLIPLGNYIEVTVDHKYHVMIRGEEVKKEEFSSKIRELLLSYKGEQDFPRIMFRVDRKCNNKDKIDEILNAIHYGYSSSELTEPLIFDMGKTSRAEPPRLEMYIDED